MNTLTAELLEVNPAPVALDAIDWVMSDEEADRLADESEGYDMVECGSYAW